MLMKVAMRCKAHTLYCDIKAKPMCSDVEIHIKASIHSQPGEDSIKCALIGCPAVVTERRLHFTNIGTFCTHISVFLMLKHLGRCREPCVRYAAVCKMQRLIHGTKCVGI